MEVEWDPNKAAINLQKHGVRFSDAEAVLFLIPMHFPLKTQRLKESSDLWRSAWIISGTC
ncbi:MAG: hypothetical protein HC916_15380 [Coleofasciculaceae cyanobacterium SM2_1_6]|nr:hypothetical protein [Coleofasciculaceae cyanobacterium SM2_1_6]